MNALAVTGIVVGAVAVVLLLALVVSYNRFVGQRNLIREAWAQVDVELRRRHDLIPNLVATVRGYAEHERQVFERITAAREAATAAPREDREQRAAAENELNGAVSSLVAVAEGYPELKANANYLQLQHELVETEDRIAAGRRFYNGNVRALNTRVESVPSNVVASLFHVEQAAYFPLEDPAARAAVAVDGSAS